MVLDFFATVNITLGSLLTDNEANIVLMPIENARNAQPTHPCEESEMGMRFKMIHFREVSGI